MAKQTSKIPVRNVIRPESLRYVDRDLYEAMKRAFLKVTSTDVARADGDGDS